MWKTGGLRYQHLHESIKGLSTGFRFYKQPYLSYKQFLSFVLNVKSRVINGKINLYTVHCGLYKQDLNLSTNYFTLQVQKCLLLTSRNHLSTTYGNLLMTYTEREGNFGIPLSFIVRLSVP